MLPTDLTYLHGEWMAVYNGLLTAYNNNKQVDNNRDNYNKRVEYFNILIMIERFLKRNKEQIERVVKIIHNNHELEFKLNLFLKDLNNYKKYAKTHINRIKADIRKKYNDKSLLISSYNYELESYNYNLKKTLWYESINKEVLKRLKELNPESGYIELSANYESASDEPHNENLPIDNYNYLTIGPEEKEEVPTNPNMSGGSLRRNIRRRSHRNRNRHCRSRSRIRNSRKNIRKTKKH